MNYQFKNKQLLAASLLICVIIVAGTVLILGSHASTPFASTEAESGTLAQGASIVTNADASGGKAVQFASSSVGSNTSGCTYNGASAPCIGSASTGASGWGAPAFDDEFTGTTLNTNNWTTLNGDSQNNVKLYTSNVSVSNGDLILTLASSSSGAEVRSSKADGAGIGYALPVGGFTEARIDFPGNGTTIYNWPAWWTSGPSWPSAGESDIAEGEGTLTVNYHSPAGANNGPTVPGIWSNSFHTYGLYRGTNYCDVYYDGALVRTYTTDDNGQPEPLVVNVGTYSTGSVYGTASQVKVDYVRAWQK
jgi:beta-glucanase (GH16 family)